VAPHGCGSGDLAMVANILFIFLFSLPFFPTYYENSKSYEKEKKRAWVASQEVLF